MLRRIQVTNTNTINKYGTKIAVRALVDNMWEIGDVGVPCLVAHDQSRLLGWMFPLAVHLEPGMARSADVFEDLKTDEDKNYIKRLRRNYYGKLRHNNQSDIIKLKKCISKYFQGREQIIDGPALAFVETDLAARTFPSLFQKGDKDSLIPLSELNPIAPGVFQIDDLIIFAHPYFRRAMFPLNSLNTSFLSRFQNLSSDLSPRIALDRDMVGLVSSCHQAEEFAYWWGPKFNNDITSIPSGVAVYEAEEEQKIFYCIDKTEFWWKTDEDEHILEIEELANREMPAFTDEPPKFGCRFVHSIVRHSTGVPRHLDGAVRAYSKDAMDIRLQKPINRAGKHSEYTKLWRIDGDVEITLWKELISDYFRDNSLIGEYFDGVDENPYLHPENNSGSNDVPEQHSAKFEYVPYSI